jgi:hypothetical protein
VEKMKFVEQKVLSSIATRNAAPGTSRLAEGKIRVKKRRNSRENAMPDFQNSQKASKPTAKAGRNK